MKRKTKFKDAKTILREQAERAVDEEVKRFIPQLTQWAFSLKVL